MPVFVVLALALASMATAAVVLAALQVKNAAGRLAWAVRAATTQLEPLVEELGQEVAVAGHELDALSSRAADRR